MRNFIGKAYINNFREIVDEQVLIEALEELGYEHIADDQRDTIIITNGTVDELYSSPYDNFEESGFINCGKYSNNNDELTIKLFLEIARMGDISEDWHFNHKYGYHRLDSIKDLTGYVGQTLTMEKFANAVRDGLIKL